MNSHLKYWNEVVRKKCETLGFYILLARFKNGPNILNILLLKLFLDV